MRERRCLWREAHAKREGESVPLLRVILPHPGAAAIRNNEAIKGKRSMRKENPKTSQN